MQASTGWRGTRAVASTDDGSAVHPRSLASLRRQHSAPGPSLSLSLLFPLSLPLVFLLDPSPRFHPFPSSRVSRPSLPGPRATTESTTTAASWGMLCASPVNVTLKTERACTYTANLRCAVRGRAPLYRTCENDGR